MSAVGDALAGIKQLLTLQLQVETLTTNATRQSDDLRRVSDSLAALDRRVVRIETMIEMTGRQAAQPRIEV